MRHTPPIGRRGARRGWSPSAEPRPGTGRRPRRRGRRSAAYYSASICRCTSGNAKWVRNVPSQAHRRDEPRRLTSLRRRCRVGANIARPRRASPPHVRHEHRRTRMCGGVRQKPRRVRPFSSPTLAVRAEEIGIAADNPRLGGSIPSLGIHELVDLFAYVSTRPRSCAALFRCRPHRPTDGRQHVMRFPCVAAPASSEYSRGRGTSHCGGTCPA
jgi:hypothetical protein